MWIVSGVEYIKCGLLGVDYIEKQFQNKTVFQHRIYSVTRSLVGEWAPPRVDKTIFWTELRSTSTRKERMENGRAIQF